MRILFVGMAESVHVVRWVSQLQDTSWQRFLFPVNDPKPHAGLKDLTLINQGEIPGFPSNRSLHYIHHFLPYSMIDFAVRFMEKRLRPLKPPIWPTFFTAQALTGAIKRIKPDIIHSLEFQRAGYLTLEAKRKFKGVFPKWIATNWGSDIYLFGRLPEHRQRVRAVLENCDFYSCECERDVILARGYGLRGEVLPVLPNAGGFDLGECESLREPGETSERRMILLKGHQTWAGRALIGLRALARCADILRSHQYTVAIFSASPDVKIAAELFALDTGISVEIIPACSHAEMLKKYGHSRVYIGLSISDAISTSLLEALVMGAFPIQSCTACADEWIVDGQTGLIVPPEDVDIIEKAIRRALTDDALVNQAASRNMEIARAKLDASILRQKAIDFYEHVYNSKLERLL